MSFLDAVLDGVFTVPGDGGIDFGAVLIALKAADYRGWLVCRGRAGPGQGTAPGVCPPRLRAFERSGSRNGMVRRK
jgi:sugar phosphate isomerase/epimerase